MRDEKFRNHVAAPSCLRIIRTFRHQIAVGANHLNPQTQHFLPLMLHRIIQLGVLSAAADYVLEHI
ncbi:hypothetical protein [Rhizobium sp. Rhizsp42]|uniref:hypothetical protein n=1 Tax=Rhizobium sp. Rhizsp42 TaxID=3243034 RepID=UPI0039B0A0C3